MHVYRRYNIYRKITYSPYFTLVKHVALIVKCLVAFHFVLTKAFDTVYVATIGRKAGQDSDVTFNVEAVADDDSDGFRITVSWDGPSDKIFEDCIDFGKFGFVEQFNSDYK